VFVCNKTFRRTVRLSIRLGLGAAILGVAVPALAQDADAYRSIETKYIFGSFTIGSSTDKAGDKAFEIESESDFGKRSGRYFANRTALEFEYSPTKYLQIDLGPTVSYHNIAGVPGLDDRNMAALNGFEADIRSIILERGPWPFGLTLSVEPEFHSRDETGGSAVVNYGLENRLEADTELVKNRVYLAFNLLYEPETTRVFGSWQDESTIGGSSALAFRITPNVIVGADLWYLRHYDGATFGSFTGDAVYLGPTLYWHIKRHMLMSAAWETQVAGSEVGPPALNFNLTDFSRNRAKLLFEVEF
jgi:hypothetical protein